MHFTGEPFPLAKWAGLLLVILFLLGLSASAATELQECHRLFLQGKYLECIRQAERAIAGSTWEEEWPLLLARAQLAVGQYAEANATMERAVEQHRGSVRVRLLGYEVFQATGRSDRAGEMLEEIRELGGSRTRSFRSAANLVALGKAALLLNSDPKLVLENFFDQAKRLDPEEREAYLASGQLALDKHDEGLAAKIFNETLKKFPNDPDAEFGLASAYAPSDRMQMGKLLQGVLEKNSNHVPSLLLLVDYQVDAEEYAAADKMLERALAVNPWDPQAWAYRGVLAHLRQDTNGETTARQSAFKFWKSNPHVDHWIGRKLSQKYRFSEGAACQRRALAFDANFLPAKIQLAQDLLRLGNEAEGWRLAEEVHQQDGYDVTAYNLVTLRETLSQFQSTTNEDFIVRMSAREAALYGDRVLALLKRAKARLTRKYAFQLHQPTVVEIFPEQKDFGVRTFGMPHNPGFLGVCFGPVVTANSPASQAGHNANWEAVLWHEFCHVITLGLTQNKMPRWLSEGISVYEERQQNPAWGQALSPRYREMILGGDLTPVHELSAAFLSPKSDLHMQFAYFESSWVVEFLAQRFGFERLQQILSDLRDGADINETIARRTEPMEKLEKDFAAFARGRAEELGPGLDWKRIPIAGVGDNPASWAELVKEHPNNYWLLMDYSKELLAAKKWEEAKTVLKKLIELYPENSGNSSGYALLAAAHRQLKETEAERAVLLKLAVLEADSTDIFSRLMELGAAGKDWRAVRQNGERFLAVNPLLPLPYRYLAQASEATGDIGAAIQAYERWLLLDPADPAEVHFRLARLLLQQGQADRAKRHVLQALEEAPRFREAQRLLLQIEKTGSGQKPKVTASRADR